MQKYKYYKECMISDREYDVIVTGGGTAGAVAAIAAAMEGADTLIVERNCYLGGSSTGGQVTPMMHVGIPGNPDSSRINSLIKKELRMDNYNMIDPCENDGWINPEMLKFTLEEILLENGGNILYDTEFIDSIVEDGALKAIAVHNKDGLSVIMGKVFIDCTGDADVAFSAGVECFAGHEASGRNQLASLRFMVGNVDIMKLHQFLNGIGEPTVLEYPMIELASVWGMGNPLGKIFEKAVDDGVLQYTDGEYFQAFSVPGMPGVLSFNCPEIPNMYNSLDSSARTGIIITGKKMIKRLYNFLKIYLPGFENSFILSVATMPGIRESRRIKGKYVLSEKDYNDRARFEDAIARTAYPVDIHGMDDDSKSGIKVLKRGEFFEIPFRCLVPEGVDNLLVGGRCISSTFTAQSSIRIQAICRATGEAAGVAAAYCSRNGVRTGDFDGRMTGQIMKQRGACL